MNPPSRIPLRRLAPAALVLLLAAPPARAADPIGDALDAATRDLASLPLETGILMDRVLALSGLDRFDGGAAAPAARLATVRQIAFELGRAALRPVALPAPAALRGSAPPGEIPLAALDVRYERLRRDALERGAIVERGGRLAPGAGSAVERRRVFAFAPLVERTWRGGDLTFTLDPERLALGEPGGALEVDFGDGRGFRALPPGARVPVRYASAGRHALHARRTLDDGTELRAESAIEVEALAAPTPDDTLHVTGTAWQGVAATGDAYVMLAPGHTGLTNPVVVPEGFDIDNAMNWDELWALLDQQGLAEGILERGFDAVVLNFTDSTEPIERNGLLVAELIRQVEAAIAPGATVAVVGPSMGGLCSRWALGWLELQGIGHRVRTWISVDAPHAGADIPLGLQYWVWFFAGQSADAAYFRDRLNRPAAREMLIYHYTDPPTSTGAPDPLRAAMLANFAALGDWPAATRRVALANGSGAGSSQGFAPAAQLIQYEYGDLLVTLKGNVWAVPELVSANVFDGRIRILFSNTTRTVNVSGTRGWDGAPGGFRATMTQLDTVPAPYGDIVALHPAHAFIPTVSALAIATGEPFYDVAGDPALLAHTPFDAVFYPSANEEHVFVSAAGAAWVLAELEAGLVGVGDDPARVAAPRLEPPAPNPSRGPTRVAFALPDARDVDLAVYDLGGREVARLARGRWPAGAHEVQWDGRDGSGRSAPAGVYFVRLAAGGAVTARRMVRIE